MTSLHAYTGPTYYNDDPRDIYACSRSNTPLHPDILIFVLQPPSSPSLRLFDISAMYSNTSVNVPKKGCFMVPSSYALTLKNSTQMEKPTKSVGAVLFPILTFKYLRVPAKSIPGMT